jgi:hypothetical protein
MSYPTAFVTDVKLIGASSWSACNNLRNQAVADGWTNAGIDLNKGVSNSWDISLFYKTKDPVLLLMEGLTIKSPRTLDSTVT